MPSSPRRYPRTARVNEVMLEVLADELERMNDPRLELLTFTGVDVSRDLSHATVFYSTMTALAAGAADGDGADALEHAMPHLRAVVGRQMRIKQVPKLHFKVDPGIVSGQRIDEILREIHHDEPPTGEAGSAGGFEEER